MERVGVYVHSTLLKGLSELALGERRRALVLEEQLVVPRDKFEVALYPPYPQGINPNGR